jgi:hypothetical protein
VVLCVAAAALKRRLIKSMVPSNGIPPQVYFNAICYFNPCTVKPNNFRQNKSGIKVCVCVCVCVSNSHPHCDAFMITRTHA